MKKTVIIFIALVGVIILVALEFGNQAKPITSQPTPPPLEKKTPPAAVNSNDSITIQYTDRGQFSPNPLEVAQGKTVVFVNASKKLLWIASDPHPLHTALPSLNSRDVLFANERYSYTFATAGSWGYHNHLAPDQHGVVVVKPIAANP